MGYFDMPRGRFDLLMKKKGRGCYKAEWKSVAITDSVIPEEIADRVEAWSKNYKVIAARFNGRELPIPTSYHWEHRIKGECIGKYVTREEAKSAVDKRKSENWYKPKDEKIPVGSIVFVKD